MLMRQLQAAYRTLRHRRAGERAHQAAALLQVKANRWAVAGRALGLVGRDGR